MRQLLRSVTERLASSGLDFEVIRRCETMRMSIPPACFAAVLARHREFRGEGRVAMAAGNEGDVD